MFQKFFSTFSQRVSFFLFKFIMFLSLLYIHASLYPPLSPLQFVDLFLLVVLFILHLPQDLQKSFHLRLGLPSILFVLGNFLLQAGDVFREFSAGLGICRCTLSLEKKLIIINKPSVLKLGDHHLMEAISSHSKGYANNNMCAEYELDGFDESDTCLCKLFKSIIGLFIHLQTRHLLQRYYIQHIRQIV